MMSLFSGETKLPSIYNEICIVLIVWKTLRKFISKITREKRNILIYDGSVQAQIISVITLRRKIFAEEPIYASTCYRSV